MATNISIKMGRSFLTELRPGKGSSELQGMRSLAEPQANEGNDTLSEKGREGLTELQRAADNDTLPEKKGRILTELQSYERTDELPAGYRLRLFMPGDEANWARIETEAGEFASVDDALRRFRDEFGASIDDMRERCIFIENGEGEPIGTATAWYKTIAGESFGRLHWVGIVPREQGRKLAKPLVAAALRVLAAKHRKAMLTSQTDSWRAIKMYLDFGFVPLLDGTEDCMEAWRWLESQLGLAIMPLAVAEDMFFEGAEA